MLKLFKNSEKVSCMISSRYSNEGPFPALRLLDKICQKYHARLGATIFPPYNPLDGCDPLLEQLQRANLVETQIYPIRQSDGLVLSEPHVTPTLEVYEMFREGMAQKAKSSSSV